MNIFELMWFILLVAGAAAGGAYGYSHFGVWGAFLGALLGGGIGFLAVLAAAFVLSVIFKAMFGGTIFRPRTLTNGHTTDDSLELLKPYNDGQEEI